MLDTGLMCRQTPKSLALENGHEKVGELFDDAMNPASISYILVDGLASLRFY